MLAYGRVPRRFTLCRLRRPVSFRTPLGRCLTGGDFFGERHGPRSPSLLRLCLGRDVLRAILRFAFADFPRQLKDSFALEAF